MFYKFLTDDHHQRLRRVRPMLALAGVAFAIGAIVGAHHSSSPASVLGSGFVGAWTRGDYAAMYGDIDAASQRRVSVSEFAGAYRDALPTATATRLRMARG